MDPHRLFAGSVVVQRVLALVRPVRNLGEGAPDTLFGLVLHSPPGLADRFEAVRCEHFLEALVRDRGRRRLGLDVAAALLGAAHVREDES